MLELLVAAAALVSVDNVRVEETNVDTVAVLTATLPSAQSEPVTVHYATVDGTADATDYVPTEGTLTFAPGVTQMRVPVIIKGDALDESDEMFFVDVNGGRGTVTITDDVNDRVPVQVLEATVAARWRVHRTYTRVVRLRVTRAPANASIDVACRGGGCPFRFGVSTRRLEGAKLRAGARVHVTVDAPGQIGRRFTFKIRAGKPPERSVSILG